jgi:inhibitor of cysteine peptidase
MSLAKEAKQAVETKAETIYSEDKQNILVTGGQREFTLKLKSNPTTGYSWFLREYDSQLLTPVKHRFQKPTDEKLMGAPGYEFWTFRVKPAGFVVPQQTILRMVYTRPWQGSDGSTQIVFRLSTLNEG